jgi:ribonuclease HI
MRALAVTSALQYLNDVGVCLVTIMGEPRLGWGNIRMRALAVTSALQYLNDVGVCLVTIMGEPRLGWGNIRMRALVRHLTISI